MKYRNHSIFDDFIAFEEYMEMKEKKSKEKKDKDKPTGRSLSFSEGMLVAFMLQWFIFPILTVYLKAHGLL